MPVEVCEASVRHARNGESGAWDELFERYQLPLFVYVKELIRDEQASLDIVQETFINAVRYIGSLRTEKKFGGWLFSIAHQKCAERWRKKKWEDPWPDEELTALPCPGEDPIELLIRKEEEEAFAASLEALPPPQRSVLLLHFLEDFSIQQIAQITGAQPGTVKSRLYYGKQALRKRMENTNENPT